MRFSPRIEFRTNQPRDLLLTVWLVLTLLATGLAPAVATSGQEGVTQSTGGSIENTWDVTCVDCPHWFEVLTIEACAWMPTTAPICLWRRQPILCVLRKWRLAGRNSRPVAAGWSTRCA